ncbi:MAG: serine--tRNA ligase [Candidatus Aureabacteria bacterium]|nr:serine--tRNA ligase [Candidatus Auribacterota bacterium]
MLDLKFIRENVETVKEGIRKKNVNVDLDALLGLDAQRRELLKEVEQLKALKNSTSKDVGRAKAKGEDFEAIAAQMKQVSQKIKEIDQQVEQIADNMRGLLLRIPNLPEKSVPVGGEKANKTIKEWGKKKTFDFKPSAHWDLCEKLDIADFKRAVKVSGTGFVVFKGQGALLERALINFMIDTHVRDNGYTEIMPPYLSNEKAMTGTGQLPNLKDDMYCLKEDGYYLIPTGEVPVTNLYSDEILKADELPIYHVAHTACFRREAGSYGKETRGMKRVHQFDKVELVKFTTAETSYDEHEKLLNNAEMILQKLNLPYRVRILASGDMSFAAAKCYDLEVYSPGNDEYLEVSSCSNFEDFQSRRAHIRYKSKEGKTAFVHTLNASGLALPRTFIAILENYQTKDGKIEVPEVLRPYMNGLAFIG